MVAMSAMAAMVAAMAAHLRRRGIVRQVRVEGEGQARVRQVVGVGARARLPRRGGGGLLVLDEVELPVGAPLSKAEELRKVLEHPRVVVCLDDGHAILLAARDDKGRDW